MADPDLPWVVFSHIILALVKEVLASGQAVNEISKDVSRVSKLALILKLVRALNSEDLSCTMFSHFLLNFSAKNGFTVSAQHTESHDNIYSLNNSTVPANRVHDDVFFQHSMDK